jgi:hypothetical protein
MPRTQVLEYVEKSLAGSSNAADTVATMLIDGKHRPKDMAAS